MSPSAPAAPGILRRIAERRSTRIQREGHALAATVPARRPGPIVPFLDPENGLLRQPGAALGALICEIKRRSPSAGAIAPTLDPAARAAEYARAGVRHLSILTEEDHFQGSLDDLVAVKSLFPDLALLRKDFLFDEQDLEISRACGADAVLLIAALHDAETLLRLHRRAEALGLAALVEVHDAEDLDKARRFRPPLVGINSRDLCSFRVDRLTPLALRNRIDWDARLVYESGVRGGEDARIAVEAGFTALLVGEAVVRRPALIPELLHALDGTPGTAPAGTRDFWGRLAGLLAGRLAGCPAGRPLVKICGITRSRDAERAAALGADLLGFVFADSPRRAHPGLLRELRGLPVLKVGVAVSEEGTRLQELLDQGLLDAVQLHGDEQPGECAALAFPYYKALRLRGPGDAEAAGRYRCPRILVDAWSPDARGGTGRRVGESLIESITGQRPLWLAGGLGPENIAEVVRRARPELVDASSRLESEPGRKDPARLEAFFRELAGDAPARTPAGAAG